MNDTIDGIPVTKRSVRFEGELDTSAQLRAGQAVPMVVLVAVCDIEHSPGRNDDYHRVDVLYVEHVAGPRSVEENEYLLGILRGEPTPGPTSVPEPEVEVEADVPETTSWLESRPGGGLQSAATPVAAVDDAALDEDDDFVLPPPPPIPEGTETRRQIVPGDAQLRTFLGE